MKIDLRIHRKQRNSEFKGKEQLETPAKTFWKSQPQEQRHANSNSSNYGERAEKLRNSYKHLSNKRMETGIQKTRGWISESQQKQDGSGSPKNMGKKLLPKEKSRPIEWITLRKI